MGSVMESETIKHGEGMGLGQLTSGPFHYVPVCVVQLENSHTENMFGDELSVARLRD